MLEFSLEYQKAINDIAGNKTANLRKYEMSENEWRIAEQLCDTLKVHVDAVQTGTNLRCFGQIFKDATLFFSRSTPNLATVILAIDHIDKMLTSQSINPKFEPSIRAALGLAKMTLNRYYSVTDHSDVYCIAMGMSPLSFDWYISSINYYIVLHPRHKLQYFKAAGWEQDWINTAEEIVRNDFELRYATSPVICEESEASQPSRKPQKVCIHFILSLPVTHG